MSLRHYKKEIWRLAFVITIIAVIGNCNGCSGGGDKGAAKEGEKGRKLSYFFTNWFKFWYITLI